MAGIPDYIEDYLKIIREELKDNYGLSSDEAKRAVYKSAVRAILIGDNEEMRRYQMHKSLSETTLDVYRQYKNIGAYSNDRTGERDANKINEYEESGSIREKHKQKEGVLQDIPLIFADDE